jgi:hypothetical protein
MSGYFKFVKHFKKNLMTLPSIYLRLKLLAMCISTLLQVEITLYKRDFRVTSQMLAAQAGSGLQEYFKKYY